MAHNIYSFDTYEERTRTTSEFIVHVKKALITRRFDPLPPPSSGSQFFNFKKHSPGTATSSHIQPSRPSVPASASTIRALLISSRSAIGPPAALPPAPEPSGRLAITPCAGSSNMSATSVNISTSVAVVVTSSILSTVVVADLVVVVVDLVVRPVVRTAAHKTVGFGLGHARGTSAWLSRRFNGVGVERWLVAVVKILTFD